MSVGNVTIRQLQDSIEAHRRLLAAANNKADDAQAQLIRIGLGFCGQQFDQLQKEGVVLESSSPETLGELIINSLKANLTGTDRQSINWPERLNEFNRRIETLQKEVDAQTRRANLAEEKVLQLQRQTSSLDQSLSRERKKTQDLPRLPDSHSSINQHPEWLQLWMKRRSFERDKQIILLIGETGYSRLLEVQQMLVQKAVLGERAVYRGVEACQEEELIERRNGVSVEGRPTDLVFLTEKGRWLFTQLSGKSAATAEFEGLLKAHKSVRHTSL
ncbi:MAG: hypothetical protein FJY85_25930, partial [Deltaproteobacteria bacterium]|nr:hypothetical protein [Deltaproteobacteria bacterium]